MKKLGWIGLGNMGLPMAKNLEKAQFPLSVYNRSADKTKSFEDTGVTVAKSLTELVSNADIIFTMVSDDNAARAIYEEIGLLDSIEGKIFIDMSTISQELTESLAKEMKAKSASFLDAPVAGSTRPATDGTLIIMVGGEEEILETVMPYLEKLGKSVKYLGNNGKGIAAKLSINYFVSLLYLGLAEAVLLAEKNGINRSDFLEIVNESAAGSGATKVKTPLLINEDYAPAFSLSLMLKDVLLAKNNGADYPLTNALAGAYAGAQKAGYGDDDVIGVIKYLQEKS
ncbi:MAG: NAD(P)-dependent oxidoreductase [Ferruginibacter sp.]